MRTFGIITAALLLLHINSSFVTFQSSVKSSGMLHFKSNGQLYVADNSHARGYALQQNGSAFLRAANTENMIIDVQWDNLKAAGEYIVVKDKGTAQFTVAHKTYSLLQQGDYVKILVSSIKSSGAFLLLQGKFEAKLHDKNGNELNVTEGRFETFNL